jgi:diguanylate cyclase (GGDEF)-like protein
LTQIARHLPKQDPVIRIKELLADLSKLDPPCASLFKQMLLRYRRMCATHTEALLEKTSHPALTGTINEELASLDRVVNQDWLQAIEDIRLPLVRDFLSPQIVEQLSGQAPEPRREYDEKFHILQAPSLFFEHLAHFRARCEEREVPVATAFVDIDDFKSFNTAYTEVVVDRNVLPRFMRCLESRVYHHGYAYRQGGDEYLLLLPALSVPLTIALLDELRLTLSRLEYPEIRKHTTVSIGLCVAHPYCPLTDRELLSRANKAKEFAKEHGKNCLATYEGVHFAEENLRVVTPTKP